MANFISSAFYEKGSGSQRRNLAVFLILLTAAMPTTCVDVANAQNAEKEFAAFDQLVADARQGDPERQKALGEALVHNLRSGGSGGPPGGFRRAFERRACRERSCG